MSRDLTSKYNKTKLEFSVSWSVGHITDKYQKLLRLYYRKTVYMTMMVVVVVVVVVIQLHVRIIY
jgi:uncharacterized membrane protein